MGMMGIGKQKALEDALVKVVGDKIERKLGKFEEQLDAALEVKVKRIVERLLKEKGIEK